MSTDKTAVVEEILSCEICLQDIPASSAYSSETMDYVMYYCGLNCYDQWQKRQKEGKKSS